MGGEDGGQMIANFELRISKFGTRPEGGSPHDNCGLMKGARCRVQGTGKDDRGQMTACSGQLAESN